MSQEKCLGIMGWIEGHRLESQYDFGEPTLSEVSGNPRYVVALMETSKTRTYVYSVCRRCGFRVDFMFKGQPK